MQIQIGGNTEQYTAQQLEQMRQYWEDVQNLPHAELAAEYQQRVIERMKGYWTIFCRVTSANMYQQLWNQHFPHLPCPSLEEINRYAAMTFEVLAAGLELEKLVLDKRDKEAAGTTQWHGIERDMKRMLRGNHKVCETAKVIYL